jgi:DNA-binding beta-propeller fold protein YncE
MAVVPDYWLGGLGRESDVALVLLRTMEVVARREVCPAPHHAAWDPSGGRIAVTCSLGDEIVVLDGATLGMRARFPVAPSDPGGPPAHAGNPLARPMNLAWSPDGSRLYVSLMHSGEVAAYTPEGEVLWRARTGDSPAQVALTRDGRRLVAVNRGDGTLALVETAAGGIRTLPLPDAPHPHGVVLSADGSIAYVTFEGTTTSGGGVLAVDLADGRILWHTAAGAYTLGVALMPGPG